MKSNRNFYLKIFIFLVVKFSIHLNRSVFVMQPRLKSAGVSALSDQSLRRTHEKLKVLIRLRAAQADLNLRWAHVPKVRFLKWRFN